MSPTLLALPCHGVQRPPWDSTRTTAKLVLSQSFLRAKNK